MKNTMTKKEFTELTQYVKRSGAKKIFVNIYRFGRVPLTVHRPNGKKEKIIISSTKPIITADPDLIIAAIRHPHVKPVDPSALELLRFMFKQSSFPTIDKNIDPGDKAAKIWRRKADMEDTIREHLTENGYDVAKPVSKNDMRNFDTQSMIDYLIDSGYTVKKMTSFKKMTPKCGRCRVAMRQIQNRVFLCTVCGKEYGLVDIGEKNLKLRVMCKDVKAQIKEDLEKESKEAEIDKQNLTEKKDEAKDPERGGHHEDDLQGQDKAQEGDEKVGEGEGKEQTPEEGGQELNSENDQKIEEKDAEIDKPIGNIEDSNDIDLSGDDTDDDGRSNDLTPDTPEPIPTVVIESKDETVVKKGTKKKIVKDTKTSKTRSRKGKKETGSKKKIVKKDDKKDNSITKKDLQGTDPSDISKTKSDFYKDNKDDDPFI